MRKISTPDAPTPKGHYSQAIVHGGVVYVAGQLAIDPSDPDAEPGDAGAQTRLIFKNIAAILDAAGSSLDRLLQVTIYVTDVSAWGAVNEAFAEALGDHRPTRAIVPVGPLNRGRDVEVVAIAAVD
ncbi:MAG: RidA family protein, partial [Gemmatimonadota bacterium]